MLQFLKPVQLKQNMAFFDNSVCWGNNDKKARAMEQVDEEKDPHNCVTLNIISVAQLERICCRLCNKKHQIIVHEASRVLTVTSIIVIYIYLRFISNHC